MRALRIGENLGGYKLLGLIARGGMGAVYEAMETRLERKVALKVIAPPNPDDHDVDELVQRFMQEARTLARVNHPNVITIYAIDTADEVPFITMELVEGISFKELLQVSFLSADLAAPMFLQMLDGLQCLHENRIIHRDLKPHNIMVRTDGTIKILDFGIAKPFDAGNFTHVGVVVGSQAYMAPEVKLGLMATEQSDLWNLGAIFYECLTGRPLHKADENIYPANSPVPHEMRTIINKMCHQKPSERFESAVKAAAEIRRFMKSRPALNLEISQSFARKVAEIQSKRRGDSRHMMTADVMPVRANPTATVRPKPSRPAKNKTTDFNWNYVLFVVVLLLAYVIYPKHKAQPTPAPVVAFVPESEFLPPPLKFIPPPVEPKSVAPEPVVKAPPVAAKIEPPPKSKPKPAKVVKKISPAPSAPKLLNARGETTADSNTKFELKWAPVKGAKGYVLQVSQDADFQKYDEHKLKDENFAMAKSPGETFWRVSTVGSEKQSEFSEIGKVQVWLPAPKLKANYVIEGLLEGDVKKIKWPAVPLAAKYAVKFGGRRDLASGEPKIVSKPVFDLPTKPGKYSLSVATADANGNVNSPFSAVSVVRIDPVAVLESPKTKEARGGRAFAWTQVPKAAHYVLEISEDEDFDSMTERATSKSNVLVLKKSVGKGKFYWRVRAENKDGTSLWSDPAVFLVGGK